MTKTALTLIAGLALAASAQAGEDYSAKSAKVVVPAPAPCLWTWFAGGSVGYLDDLDTEMYTLHVGAEYKCPDSSCSHAIYLEAGYAEQDYSGSYFDYQSGPRYDWDVDVDIIPVTLNYKFECALTGNLNWYIGAGAGIAIIDVDYDDTAGNSGSADETEFLAQAFTGLVYNFSESFEAFGGARYIYITDNDLDNLDVYGDDFFYELGVRFNF